MIFFKDFFRGGYHGVSLSGEDHHTSRVEAEEGNFVLIPTGQHLQLYLL